MTLEQICWLLLLNFRKFDTKPDTMIVLEVFLLWGPGLKGFVLEHRPLFLQKIKLKLVTGT